MLIGGIALAALIAAGIAVVIWRRAALGPRLRRLTNEQGWVAECPACRVVSPAGDAGRIRVHAADREMLCLLRCPSCAKRTMMRVFRRADAAAELKPLAGRSATSQASPHDLQQGPPRRESVDVGTRA